jgi:hypothetical protein
MTEITAASSSLEPSTAVLPCARSAGVEVKPNDLLPGAHLFSKTVAIKRMKPPCDRRGPAKLALKSKVPVPGRTHSNKGPNNNDHLRLR